MRRLRAFVVMASVGVAVSATAGCGDDPKKEVAKKVETAFRNAWPTDPDAQFGANRLEGVDASCQGDEGEFFCIVNFETPNTNIGAVQDQYNVTWDGKCVTFKERSAEDEYGQKVAEGTNQC